MIKEAFGIGRAFGAIELDFINKWKFTYRMSTEMIREACNRTLLTTGKPDFKYADGILSGWFRKNISDLDGVAAEDAEHAAKAQNSPRAKAGTPEKSANKFNQFPQRTYTESDYTELEKKKLRKL